MSRGNHNNLKQVGLALRAIGWIGVILGVLLFGFTWFGGMSDAPIMEKIIASAWCIFFALMALGLLKGDFRRH
jgi:hypothetical protein